MKKLKFGNENEFENDIVTFLNQDPRIWLITKFCEKIKTSEFEIKNALLGYFWARISKNQLSYLKSTSSNFSNCKIS